MAARRLVPIVLVALSFGAAACGSDGSATQVSAGGDPAGAATTTAAPDPTLAPSTTAPATTAPPATTTPSTTAPTVADPGDSPVAGLDAAQLERIVEAPLPGTARTLRGPMVDRVVLPDGTAAWRVRIPGSFTVGSARTSISVGGRTVGEAVVARDLGSITAVTTDGTGLTAGQPVRYQREGGAAVAAGALAVIR